MKLKNNLLLITITILLLIPQAQSLEILNAELVWNDEPITYYSKDTNIVAHLNLEISTENIDQTTINISDLNNRYLYASSTNNYDSLDLSNIACEQQDNKYNCSLRNLILRTTDPQIEITAKQGQQQTTKNITLQKTTANPEVTFLGTTTCHNNECYIKSGRNTIDLKLSNSDAGFSRAMIGLRLGPHKGSIAQCEGNECEGYISTTCSDGQKLQLMIAGYRSATTSRDDAGRKISSEPYDVTCDAEHPELKGMQIIDASDIGITQINEQFRISANLTDATSPIINMKVLGENINTDNTTGQCSLSEGLFKCVADIKPQVEQKGIYEIPVIFTDVVGHEIQDTISVELLEVKKDETPNFWQTQPTTQSINSMSYRNMALDRTIFIEVPLQGNADLLNVNPSNFKCVPVIENVTGLKRHISNIKVMKTDLEDEKIFLSVEIKAANMDPTQENMYTKFKNLEYDCGLELLSKKDGYFYNTPEQKNFTLKLTITDADSLDRYVYETIEQRQEKLTRNIEAVDGWERGINGMVSVCNLIAGTDTAQASLAGIEAGLVATGVGMSAVSALKSAGDSLEEFTGKAVQNKMVTICEYLTCRSSITDVGYGKLNDFFGGEDALGLDMLAEETGITKQQMLDPYKSQVAAAMTMCVPAYIYHERVKQGIECSYLRCLSEDMRSYGVSAQQCVANREYSTCLRQAGNVLYAIPYTNIYSDLMTDVKDVFSDPAALLGGATTFACKFAPPQTGVHSVCVITQKAMSIPAHINRIKSFFDISQYTQHSDTCTPVLEGGLAQSRAAWEAQVQSQSFGRDTPSESDGITTTKSIDDENTLVCKGEDCRIIDKNKKTVAVVRQDDNERLILYDGSGKSWKSVNTQNMAQAKQKIQDQAIYNHKNAIQEAESNFEIEKTTQYVELTEEYDNYKEYENLKENSEKLQERENAIKERYAQEREIDDGTPEEQINEFISQGISQSEELANINSQQQEVEKELEKFVSDPRFKELLNNLNEIDDDVKGLNDLNMEKPEDRARAREILTDAGIEENLEDVELSEIDELLANKGLNDALLDESNRHYREYMDMLEKEAPGAHAYAMEAQEARKDLAKSVKNYAVNQDATKDLFDGVKDIRFFNRGKDFSDLNDEDQERLKTELNNIAHNKDVSKEIQNKAKDLQTQLGDEESDLSANKIRRELNKPLRSERRDMRKQQRKEARSSLMEKWSLEMESMSDISRVREGISGMKGFKDLLGVDLMFKDTSVTRALDAASQPEKLWCDKVASKTPRIQGEGGDGSITTKTGSGTKPGAYILARKSTLQTPPTDEEPYYNYWVEGGIMPQKDGLRFKVILYDVNGRQIDYTEKILNREGEGIADIESPAYFGGIKSQHVIKSEENYDKICISFQTDRLSDYFYTVDLRGKQLCQKFVGER